MSRSRTVVLLRSSGRSTSDVLAGYLGEEPPVLGGREERDDAQPDAVALVGDQLLGEGRRVEA